MSFKIFVTNIVGFAYGKEAAQWEKPSDVYPSAHYFMGGIKINEWGKVKGVKNLFACGEVTGGVHGGNRLGSVSLGELFIFGKRAGERAIEEIARDGDSGVDNGVIDQCVNELKTLIGKKGKYRPISLKGILQKLMWEKVGPIREENGLKEAISEIRSIEGKYNNMVIPGEKVYNTDLLDVLELKFMIPVAKSISLSALARKESRGAHIRLDYPKKETTSCFNIIAKKTTGDEIVTEIRPAKLSVLKPLT